MTENAKRVWWEGDDLHVEDEDGAIWVYTRARIVGHSFHCKDVAGPTVPEDIKFTREIDKR